MRRDTYNHKRGTDRLLLDIEGIELPRIEGHLSAIRVTIALDLVLSLTLIDREVAAGSAG